MIALTVALALFVGVSLGLLGGGGSILTVPLLVYVAGLDATQAIASSLLVVSVSSAVGAIAHVRAGRVRWGVALRFGAAAMIGASGGGVVARFISATVLQIAFAVIMIVAGGAMLRGRQNTAVRDDTRHMSAAKLTLLGVAVGAMSGIVGAGGGFLWVPALAMLAGLPMPAAVGTSLVVIAMQSFAGLAGHLASGYVNWGVAAMVTAAAVIGGLIGGRITGAIDPDTLRTYFGWFVLLMASVILALQTKLAVGAASAALAVLGAGVYVSCRRTTHCPVRRLIARAQSAEAASPA